MAATAGSRTQKIGSVFSRARNLVRTGLLRKPLWLDVYAAFPPLREPVYRVPRPRYRSRDRIGAVFYREDTVRARFYKVYGNGPKPFDLTQLNFKSTCQRFVEKYNELKEEGKIQEEKLFEETGKALLASGILLQRRGVDKALPPPRDRLKTAALDTPSCWDCSFLTGSDITEGRMVKGGGYFGVSFITIRAPALSGWVASGLVPPQGLVPSGTNEF
ncbi:28S ribosomal protein S23, mitochondrial isoform X1 [Pyrgilauda ruficollis]|uniref:28S ribosomal protein S23, mitochondrial isoform X1 n=1 Tax=Pyrgilauda ruficollis TaxID=221976 RepID=UPI001B87B442|nr:28S ribosomal protein S23, mitochondrial isoform X1 [Pyrgilauda ruficollis]